LINADPDAMASAFALKRLFWRKVKRVDIDLIKKIGSNPHMLFVRPHRVVLYTAGFF